jgi:hypothetical protein
VSAEARNDRQLRMLLQPNSPSLGAIDGEEEQNLTSGEDEILWRRATRIPPTAFLLGGEESRVPETERVRERR